MGVWFGLCVLGALSWPDRRSRRVTTNVAMLGRPLRRLAIGVAAGGLALGALEIAALVARWNAPEDSSRYALVLVPFAALLQAGAAVSPRRVVRVCGVAGVLCLLAWNEASYVRLVAGTPIDWSHDPAVAEVRRQMRPGDAVIFNDRARRLRFDLVPHAGIDDYVVHSAGQTYLQAGLRADAEAVVAAAVRRDRRIWYLNAGDPPNTPPFVRRALAFETYALRRDLVDGTDLSLWAVGTPDGATMPMAAFGGVAVLREARFSRAAAPGGDLLVDLTWDCARPINVGYTVFVHLEDGTGKLVAQHDGEPGAGLLPTTSWQPGTSIADRHGVSIPASATPGNYRLVVGLYRGDQRLSLPDGANQLDVGDVVIG